MKSFCLRSVGRSEKVNKSRASLVSRRIFFYRQLESNGKLSPVVLRKANMFGFDSSLNVETLENAKEQNLGFAAFCNFLRTAVPEVPEVPEVDSVEIEKCIGCNN